MATRTTRMSAAEYKSLREHLGVTGDWLSERLGVVERQGRRWENGASPIPPGVTAELGALVDQADDAVDQLVADLQESGATVIPVWVTQEGWEASHPGTTMPASWWRRIAARALTRLPHLTIIAAD